MSDSSASDPTTDRQVPRRLDASDPDDGVAETTWDAGEGSGDFDEDGSPELDDKQARKAAKKAAKAAEKAEKLARKAHEKTAEREAKKAAEAEAEERAAREGKAKLGFESAMEREEAASYLESVVEGLRKGSVHFRQGDESLGFEPADRVELEVKASRKHGREKLSIEIEWRTDEPEELSIVIDEETDDDDS